MKSATMDAPENAESGFTNLSIVSVTFSALSALFGCYFILFILAIWSTYQKDTVAARRLRIVTILLFIVLSTHYTVRALMFSQARLLVQPKNEVSAWQIPLIFVGCITSTLSGLIADGLLAWRFMVIFGRAKWALYLPVTAVAINALLGFSGDFQIFTFYGNVASFYSHIYDIEFKINAAWGWTIFATNSMFTGLIIARIVYVSNQFPSEQVTRVRNVHYATLIAAIVESGLVTWIGLLLYGITSVAPTGHITTNMDVGFVMICIVPVFFGISQCLMIVRLSLSNTVPTYAAPSVVKNYGNGSKPEELEIRIRCETNIDAGSTSSVDGSLKGLDIEAGLGITEKVGPCA